MSRPLQNRVLATGDIVSDPARGIFMGNRGILHNDQQVLGRARWKHKAWVTCVLKHKNWHRKVMTPGRYTELFFLDEAISLAAGHRPCALCRNKDFKDYRAAAGLSGSSKEMDAVLHTERAIAWRFEQRRHVKNAAHLPDFAIIYDGAPKLIRGGALYPVSAAGYSAPEPMVRGIVTVLTPPTSLTALAAGYQPTLHKSLSA